MYLPNFLCIGVPKAGTTTLYYILKQHPDIFLPETKDICFFYKEEMFSKGVSWYSNEFFNKYNGEKVIGEIAADYLTFDPAAKRIYDTLGEDVKFIVLLRNPAERAYSAYLMLRKLGEEKAESFLNALEFNKGYIRMGLYATLIKKFLKYYSKDNIHFVFFEELIKIDNQKVIDEILEFLEVSIISLNSKIHGNKGGLYRFQLWQNMQPLIWLDKVIKKVPLLHKWIVNNASIRDFFISFFLKKPEKLTLEIKQSLTEKYFIDEIKELEQMIGKDLSHWYSY